MVRVFRTKAVSRFFRRERIRDARLNEIVSRLEKGAVDADLGGGLFKQRLARSGQGKRGGYRVLIGFRSQDRAVFLFGFAKNEQDNIDDKQLMSLREISAAWLDASNDKLTRGLADGLLIEVTDASKSEDEYATDA